MDREASPQRDHLGAHPRNHGGGAGLRNGELENGFTLRELYRKHWHALASRADAQGAVDVLEELGWLHEVQVKTDGRWTVRYEVSPQVREARDGEVD